MNDDQLDSWLRASPARPALPASFPREVWARIAESEASSPLAAVRERGADFLAWLSRPLPAFTMVLAMIAVGAGSGVLSAARKSAQQHQTYIASIDPLHSYRLPADR